ncbi:MAG TPA: spermidine/putrescine ABC transporter substrate-binding protein [Thermoleophilia bacterium]|nr:spermidine/putrescine ABC transporter substrate-binding protein [Thermoleophilia bacterium]
MQNEREDGQGPMESAERLAQEVCAGRLSRREFMARAAALGLGASALAGLLAACGTEEGGGTAASASPTTLPEKLFIYNWSDYSSSEVYRDFEEQFGVRVVESFYDGNEELVTKLKAGASGYDVIIPTDKWVSNLSKSGLIMPLDMSLIPNFDKYVTDPLFQKPPFDNPDEQGGKKYSVPYMFGTTGMGVRRDKVENADAVDSWAIMWDPKYKGGISMLNEPAEGINVALMLLGLPANSIDQGEIDQATQKLIEQKPLVAQYTSTVDKRLMIQGVPLVHCWDGDAAMAIRDVGDKLRYVLPKEGFMLWMDGIAVPATAPSPYAAHLFLNFILDPVNAAGAANAIGYQPAVPGAMEYVTDPVQKAMQPTPEILNAGQLPVDLGAFEQMYQDAWAEVKSA